MAGARVKITNGTMRGRDTHIEVDGVDISKACHRATLRFDSKELNTLELDLFTAPDLIAIEVRRCLRLRRSYIFSLSRLLATACWERKRQPA